MGIGKVRVVSTEPPVALLYAFDVGSPVLKPQHSDWLIKNMPPYLTPVFKPQHSDWVNKNRIPYLTPYLGIFIIGLASRTGSDGFNMDLSWSRVRNVEGALQDLARAQGDSWWRAAARSVGDLRVALGEEAARIAGIADGVEDERYRGVLIGVGKAPPPAIKDYFADLVKRRTHVRLLLSQKTSQTIPMDPQDRRAENIANLSDKYGRRFGLLPDPIEKQDFQTIREDWTVLKVTIKRSTRDGLVIFEYLDVDYEWGPARDACLQRKFVEKVRDEFRRLDPKLKDEERPMSVEEMNEWLNHPFRAWLGLGEI